LFVDEVRAEYARIQKATTLDRTQTLKQLQDIDKRTKAILNAIKDGLYQPEFNERLHALAAEKARLQKSVAGNRQNEGILLLLNLHELYVRKVNELEVALVHANGTRAHWIDDFKSGN
jgi:hypothetical protein